MSRRIVHPSDFSSASSAAFRKAIEMAKADRAELMIVNVIGPIVPIAGDGYMAPKMYEDLRASAIGWSRKQLHKLVAKAKQSRVRAKAFILEGPAPDQIVRFAKSKRADMVVMGTHGRSGFKKLLLGSVAERVVAGARCPVLTVHGK
jgi:nucleotide-binding universal stress UspA family protein